MIGSAKGGQATVSEKVTTANSVMEIEAAKL